MNIHRVHFSAKKKCIPKDDFYIIVTRQRRFYVDCKSVITAVISNKPCSFLGLSYSVQHWNMEWQIQMKSEASLWIGQRYDMGSFHLMGKFLNKEKMDILGCRQNHHQKQSIIKCYDVCEGWCHFDSNSWWHWDLFYKEECHKTTEYWVWKALGGIRNVWNNGVNITHWLIDGMRVGNVQGSINWKCAPKPEGNMKHT